jgi:hypothetical protein
MFEPQRQREAPGHEEGRLLIAYLQSGAEKSPQSSQSGVVTPSTAFDKRRVW